MSRRPELSVRATHGRFVQPWAGLVASLDFRRHGDRLVLLRVRTPDPTEDLARVGALVRRAVQQARAEHLVLVPVCPEARSWLRDHPEVGEGTAIDWTS